MDQSGQDQDKQLIDQLGKLKDRGPEYPAQLREKRRTVVLAGLAAIPAAHGILGGAAWFAKFAKAFKAMALIEKVVVAAELTAVVGLTTYGVVTAYAYRYTLQRLLFPAPANVTPFPTLSIPSPAPERETGETAAPTSKLTETPTMTVTPFATWTVQPGAVEEQPQPAATQAPAGGQNPAEVQPTATRGLRLGQTKTPVATP